MTVISRTLRAILRPVAEPELPTADHRARAALFLWPDRGLTALLAASLLYAFAQTEADMDLWGHLRFGLDMWRDGRIVADDPYSYLSGGQPWINHEWLAEAIFAWLYDRGGMTVLILFKAAVALGLAFAAYAVLRRDGFTRRGALLWTVLVTALIRPGVGTIRPQLFTYASFFLLLVVCDLAERGRTRLLWLLPPLFAVWANAHGGVVAGLGTIALWWGSLLISRERDRKAGGQLDPFRPLTWAPLVAAAAATLANPYGARLLLFLREAFEPRPEITEWNPIVVFEARGLFLVLVLTVTFAAISRSRMARRPFAMLMLAVTALLPFHAVRHTPLFAIAVLLLAGPHLVDWARQVTGALSPTGEAVPSAAARRTLTAGLMASATALVVLAIPRASCARMPDSHMPVRAVALMQAAGASGNLAVMFDWGEYLIWHLGPAVKVSIDGRRETVYTRTQYLETVRFESGVGEWNALVRRPETHMALVALLSPTFNLMAREPGWTLGYQDRVSGLFVREASANLSALRRTLLADGWDAEPGQCFP